MAKMGEIKVTVDAEAFIEALDRATESFNRLTEALRGLDGQVSR